MYRPPRRRAVWRRLVASALVAIAGIGIGVTIERAIGSAEPQPAGVHAPAWSWAPVMRDASRGVVTITSTVSIAEEVTGLPSDLQSEATVLGTGFVLDRAGNIVTNHHVVADAVTISVHFADGVDTPGSLVGTDASTDLAVIKIAPSGARLFPLRLGSSAGVSIGDPVLAIGSPFGYDRSASAGIVSGIGRELTSPSGYALVDAVQTDAALNHGNSGGPLLDVAGRVIGVNAQNAAESGVDANVGVAFAIPMNAATRKVIAELRDHGKASHPWLGVSGVSIDADLAAAGRLRAQRGVLVEGVVAGSPADAAGLRPGVQPFTFAGRVLCGGGDIVTHVDGRAVATTGELRRALEAAGSGATVRLGIVLGDGTTAIVKVRLVAQPDQVPDATTGC